MSMLFESDGLYVVCVREEGMLPLNLQWKFWACLTSLVVEIIEFESKKTSFNPILQEKKKKRKKKGRTRPLHNMTFCRLHGNSYS
jgi:hypothetical protein